LIPQLSARELAAWRRDSAREAPLIVDVRERWEFAHCSIDESLSVPLQELPGAVKDLPRDRDIVVVCHHGVRSEHAAAWLARAGFERVHNLAGGVAAWATDVDPAMKRY
jgi:rhodanese-related sulfurtransferase